VLTLLVGVSLLGCGLASWRTWPQNRVGKIMACTGFAWFAAQLVEATSPWLNTIGLAVQSVWIIGLIYLLLSFPSGRLQGRLDRALVTCGVAAGVGLQLLAMLDGNKAGLRCPGCANNLLQVVHENQKALGLLNLQRLIGAVLIVIIIALLVGRWLRASAAHRRAVAPVVVTGCATLAALRWTVVFDLLGDPLGALPADVYFTAMASVPIAVLYVFLQRRLARGMVAGLVVELGQPSASADLRDALARALGDPSLELAFWFPAEKCYVDGDGGVVKLPDDDRRRRSTFVARDGQPIAVLLHDPVLEHNAELVASVCAAASLSLENERLQASYALGWSSCRPRAPGWSRRPTPSGAGSSATSMTAPSSGGSRSRCRSAFWRASCPRRRPPFSRLDRERRLLHGQRGADERRQALLRQRGPRRRLLRRPAPDHGGRRRRHRRRHHLRRLGAARTR
jgi:hypothetical protein